MKPGSDRFQSLRKLVTNGAPSHAIFDAIDQLESTFAQLRAHADQVGQAQADALVNSAMIVYELETEVKEANDEGTRFGFRVSKVTANSREGVKPGLDCYVKDVIT